MTAVALTGELQCVNFQVCRWWMEELQRGKVGHSIFQMFLKCLTSRGKIWTHLALVDPNKYWTLEVCIRWVWVQCAH